jgi:inorganic pyrophosphatase
MHMVDQGEIDDKIIAVAKNDMAYSEVHDLKDIPKHITIEI